MAGIKCILQPKGKFLTVPKATLPQPVKCSGCASSSSSRPRPGRAISRRTVSCQSAAKTTEKLLKIDLSPYPEFRFFKVEAIIRPWRLSDVIHDLSANGILGCTATQVLGAGVQGGSKERYSGIEHGLGDLLEKSKLEVVCTREQVNKVVRIITNAAKTGEVGDGKLFIQPVAEIVRIRTEEIGASAERMGGGMADSNILTSMDK